MPRTHDIRIGLAAALMVCGMVAPAVAQAPAQPYVPRQSDRPAPATEDEPGFQTIFDGKTLSGWDGNPAYWRVENGTLVGEITPETVIKSNTFIIWRGGRPRDFDLKLDYRITPGGNSGINYRSAQVPDPVTPANKFAMKGYQFDIDGRKQYVGNNYEEKGRLFLALRGQMTRIVGGRVPVLTSTFADGTALAKHATDDWNAVHIMVRGTVLTHLLNGQLMCVVVDEDGPNRPADGELGMQVHVGPPMKIEYRNIRIKNF